MYQLRWTIGVLSLVLSACAGPTQKQAEHANETLERPRTELPDPHGGSAAQDSDYPQESVVTAHLGSPTDTNLGVQPNAGVHLDVATPPDNIWTRVREGFQFPSELNYRRVQKHLARYESHPDYLWRVTSRAEPFLYLILEEIERRNLPSDLVLLPIVESAYRPFAYSHGRAAGLWQFIPGTGRLYGLKQNWWYDGRRDVYASTQAALDYLSRLNKRFEGDWLLTLAAYNAGPNAVSRAINKNRRIRKPTNYWSLDLPRETDNYVPKLLALKAIVEAPDKFGIKLKPIKNKPLVKNIDTGSQIDLALAAELADMDVNELYQLNPGFNRWATDPTGPHRLLVPLAKAAEFEARLAMLPAAERVTWIRHKIEQGQTLSHIARKYDTTVALLKKTNKLRSSRIRAGRHLLVPRASRSLAEYTLTKNQRKRAHQTRSGKGQRHYHVVARGESFWSISRNYGVSTKTLAKWNAMAPRDVLRPGDRLVVWKNVRPSMYAPPQAPVEQMISTIRYRVKRGDSLYGIAKRFRVNITDLKRWNDLKGDELLYPGQAITVRVAVSRQSGEG